MLAFSISFIGTIIYAIVSTSDKTLILYLVICVLLPQILVFGNDLRIDYNEDKKDELRDKFLIKLGKDSTNLQKDKFIDDYVLSYRKVNNIKEEDLLASPEVIRNILMDAEKRDLKHALDRGVLFASEEEKNEWIDEYYKSHQNIYNISETP